MKIPNQSKPVGHGSLSASHVTGIKPSDCTDGDINVILPDGGQATLKYAIGCCFDYPDCNPCSGYAPNDYYDAIVGTYLPICGTSNINNCYYWVSCNGY